MKTHILILLAAAFWIHRTEGAFFSWGGAGSNGPPTEAPLPPCGTSPIPLNPELNSTVDAQLGQVVWEVSVMTKGMGAKWAHTCGGALIGRQAVLTSASCVDG